MASSQTTPALSSNSLADRISKAPTPVDSVSHPAEGEGSAAKTSWADEVASPVVAEQHPIPPANDVLDQAQTDGAGEVFGGSDLREPEYDVQVKLSDIQADPNNPLYSVKSFEDLGGL